jgi:transmembrane sensor
MSDDQSGGRSSLDEEAYTWVMRFAAGKASAADIAALKQWCAHDPKHAEAFDRVSRIWKALGPLGQELVVEGVLSTGANHQAGANAAVRSRLGRRAVLGGALAASAAGIAIVTAVRPPLGLWPSWSELAADYRTRTGEQRKVVLSDNTSIELNTQTSVDLRRAGDERGRIELIAGEAMISASPEASGAFTVLAADGRIVVTDARFNVRCQDRAVCVTCVAGNVSVELGTAVVQLLAGQQVLYSVKGIGPAVAVDSAVVTAWQDGIVIFKATPVSEVVAEVNRYRSGKIILTNDALGRHLFTARLRIATIDRVVGQIEQAFGARATTLPGGIVLLG